MGTQYMHVPSQSYGPQSFNANDNHGQSGKSGNFAFKKRFEHIDWRKIASIDIDQISRTLDFNALQENVMNLTYCNIESELDMRMVDPNFVKLFKLAQFTIEYLLHSQDYLAEMVKGSEDKVHQAEQEMQKVREEMEKLKLELTETKKESHKRKKLLIAQQQMMHAGADSYHKCPFCSKAFLNISFLQAHIFRRHNEYSSKASSSEAVHASSGTSLNKTLEAELVNIKERLQMTEAALKEERRMNRSLTKSLKEGDHEALVEMSRDIHQDRLHEEEMQREIEEMKQKYEGAIRDLNQQLQSSERALVQLKNGRRSNLGSLEDDDDDELNRRSPSRKSQEVSNLQEELRFMKEQMEKQDRKWSKKFNEVSKTKNKLMEALEKTDKDLSTSQQIKSPETEHQHRENENILRKSREEEQFMKKMEEEIERRNEEQNRINNLKKQNRRERHVTTTKETVVETFERRTRKPGLQVSPPARSPSPRRDLVHKMEPSDDEDDTELGTGTGTGSMLTSGKKTGTLGSTQGSFGSRSLKTMDYLNHLRNNPTLDILKKEILEKLEQRLEDIGVNPKSEGITDYVCDNKLAMLKTQRNALEKKHHEFARIRQKVDAESTAEAKRRYRELSHSPRMDTYNTSPTTRRTFPHASQLFQSSQPIQSTVPNPSPRPRSAANQPVPTPRSNKTLQSTGSTTEWTSTQWDSDEESEEESRQEPVFSSPHNRTPNAAPRLIVSQPLTNSQLDDSWDSESESPRPAVAQPRVIMSKPRGENVSRLSQSIELQLNNRSNAKKPAGAVNTVNSNDVFDDEWDSDEDIKPKARRPPTRASTEYSTNTYDTSQWGSSSKVASTLPPETKRSGSKSSFVSVTDVSSDEDLNTENI